MIHTVLVIEDDKDLQLYLKELLQQNGFAPRVASDGISALSLIKKSEPDLVLLDLNLPNMSGESVCMEIHKNWPGIRVIILTAKDSVSDVVQGLNLGADDYITKPFVTDEILARVRARLRHSPTEPNKLQAADLQLDNQTFEVTRGGKTIALTPQEFKLLQYLLSNKGRVLTRDMILNRIWLYSPDVETRVVDVYVGYLRKKIDSGYKKKLLHSVRGFGYTIRD